LTVNWNSYAEDFVSDETGLSDSLVKQVTGNIAVDERGGRVYPLTNFPDHRVLEASRGLLTKHSTSFPMEKILEQRHNVRMVPVAVVAYDYKKENGSFHVYGLERKVYFPNYPAKCCCGMCVVM
jgi:hypothetical protein